MAILSSWTMPPMRSATSLGDSLAGGEERIGEAHQVGAEGDGLGHVEPGTHAAAADHGHPRDPAQLADRLRRGDAPIGEQLAELEVARRLASIRAQLVPPTPAVSRMRDAEPAERPAGRLGHAAADLLGDHRHVEPAHHLAILGSRPSKLLWPSGCSASCSGFRCRASASAPIIVHGPPAVVDADAVVELHAPEVGEQRDRRSHLAHPEARRLGGVLERLALRAHAHRHAGRLGPRRQVAVDPAGLAGTAGHAGDEQRRRQPLAEEGHRGVDRVEVDLGQGRVLEAVVVEELAPSCMRWLERQAMCSALRSRARAVGAGPAASRAATARGRRR